jgi:ABC-type uncharacterized transport system substrate-binding protein
LESRSATGSCHAVSVLSFPSAAQERAAGGNTHLEVKRREFITLLGGSAAWPLAAHGQQPGMPVIGFLGSASADLWSGRLRAFHQGLSVAGYVEGRNAAVEYRWAEGRNDQLPALAADLVRRKPTVIAALGSTPAALAAKAATATIPIVFEIASDPVELGLIASLARPDGNLTGITSLNVEAEPKRLQLLHDLIPIARIVALLVNPTNLTLAQSTTKVLEAAARRIGVQLHVLYASTERDFDVVFATAAQVRAGALVIGADPLFTSRLEELAVLALRHALPAAYQFREFALAGGLVSYGTSLTDGFRSAGMHIGRILKGEKPGELPVQQATKVEPILNLKTAKTLGLDVPLGISAGADEVIE